MSFGGDGEIEEGGSRLWSISVRPVDVEGG